MSSYQAVAIRAGQKWHPIEGVIDVRFEQGEFQLQNGKTEKGDMVAIIMEWRKYDAGQMALKKLADMDPRIVDLQAVTITGTVNFSVIVMDVQEEVEGARGAFAVLARSVGVKRAGLVH